MITASATLGKLLGSLLVALGGLVASEAPKPPTPTPTPPSFGLSKGLELAGTRDQPLPVVPVSLVRIDMTCVHLAQRGEHPTMRAVNLTWARSEALQATIAMNLAADQLRQMGRSAGEHTVVEFVHLGPAGRMASRASSARA